MTDMPTQEIPVVVARRGWWERIDWSGAAAFVLSVGLALALVILMVGLAWRFAVHTVTLSWPAAVLLSLAVGGMLATIVVYAVVRRKKEVPREPPT